jgi:hypothetical protein
MRAAAGLLVTLLLVAPASAGATGTRPSVALTASPAHVTLEGSGSASVRIANSGRERVVVDVRRAGFSLDLRGRPRILPLRSSRTADSWLRVRPSSFAVRPGGTVAVNVTAKLPRHVEPGDHDALVLLTTRRRAHGRVAVRMRLGVVVSVRAPGRVVHRLSLRGLLLRAHGRTKILEALVANRGNVTEDLAADRISVLLSRSGRLVARLRPEPRELLPRTRGYVAFRYRGGVRGVVSALVKLSPAGGGAATYRVYRLRL